MIPANRKPIGRPIESLLAGVEEIHSLGTASVGAPIPIYRFGRCAKSGWVPGLTLHVVGNFLIRRDGRRVWFAAQSAQLGAVTFRRRFRRNSRPRDLPPAAIRSTEVLADCQTPADGSIPGAHQGESSKFLSPGAPFLTLLSGRASMPEMPGAFRDALARTNSRFFFSAAVMGASRVSGRRRHDRKLQQREYSTAHFHCSRSPRIETRH